MEDIKKEIYVKPTVEELDLEESFNFGMPAPVSPF
jgi:hypothetical protein